MTHKPTNNLGRASATCGSLRASTDAVGSSPEFKVTSATSSPGGTGVCSSGCYYDTLSSGGPDGNTRAPRASDMKNEEYIAIHASGAIESFPHFVGFQFPNDDSEVLNELTLFVHVNGFYEFDIEGSNSAGTWIDGGTMDPNQEEWELIKGGLFSNGRESHDQFGESMADTHSFTNDKAFRM